MTIKATTKAVVKYLEAIKKNTRKKFYLLVVMKQAQLDMDFAADYKRLDMAA